MSKITVYKFRPSDKENGRIVTLKDGVDFQEYATKMAAKDIAVIRIRKPTMRDLEEIASDSVCESIDGCGPIELDGTCEHGFPSLVRIMGFI